MRSYKLLYENVEFGILDVDLEKNLHRYTHNEDGLKLMKEKGLCPFQFIDFSKDTDWIEPIPFLANRIKNCARFQENPKVIGYQTDGFRLILI